MHGFMFLGVGVAVVIAQNTSSELTPPVQQRVEVLLRSKVELPTATTLSFKMGPRANSRDLITSPYTSKVDSQELAGISLF
jgi:hypothetical protein